MRQPSLFDPPPKPAQNRPMNLDGFRKVVGRYLWTLKQAEFFPWNEDRLELVEEDFARNLQYLPLEEQEEMKRVYKTQTERLRALDAA
jgi:hypothetical protein